MTSSTDFKHPRAVFLCEACLTECSPEESSADPRYCKFCYGFLRKEAKMTQSVRKRWVPCESTKPSPDLGVLVGDRVQLLGQVDEWFPVEAVDGDALTVTRPAGASSACATSCVDLSLVCAHQMKKERKMVKVLSPYDNLLKCRDTLARLLAKDADPRAIGLWRAKVAQAELLCKGTPVQSAVRVNTSAGVVVPAAEPKVQGSTFPTVLGPVRNAPSARDLAGGGHPCACGCDKVAAKGRNFVMGHDSRFAAYVRKYDNRLLKAEDLPELVRAMVLANHELVQRARLHNAGAGL